MPPIYKRRFFFDRCQVDLRLRRYVARRLRKNGDWGCWIWQGPRYPDGTPRAWVRESHYPAVRVVSLVKTYENGDDDPEWPEILLSKRQMAFEKDCKTRNCVNPLHYTTRDPKE